MNLDRHKLINTILLLALFALVMFYVFQLAEAKRDIALFNEDKIENNTVFECRISYIGDLHCRTPTVNNYMGIKKETEAIIANKSNIE